MTGAQLKHLYSPRKNLLLPNILSTTDLVPSDSLQGQLPSYRQLLLNVPLTVWFLQKDMIAYFDRGPACRMRRLNRLRDRLRPSDSTWTANLSASCGSPKKSDFAAALMPV